MPAPSLPASERARCWALRLGPQDPEEGEQPGASGGAVWSCGGVSIFSEILVAELAHMGLAVICELAGVVPYCAFAAAGGICGGRVA